MLNSIELDDKQYEDLMAEALALIPLYSKEWTNFNRSDPGITTLQNLSAFTLLQRGAVNTVTDAVRRRLLALVGYRAGENRAATLLLQVPPGTSGTLPPQYRLEVGALCLETEDSVDLYDWGLAAMYAQREDSFQDITCLLDARAGSSAVFGSRPQAGDSLCCVLEGVPPQGPPLLLWVQSAGEEGRNPFPDGPGPVFARTRWQYYTQEGWADAEAEDETRGLLTSGAVTLRLTAGPPAVFTGAPVHGCALRCLLEEADYDRPPRVQSLAANLFPVRQWQTHSMALLFPGQGVLTLQTPLATRGHLFVYGRELPGGPYRAYHPYPGLDRRGRFYLREEGEDGVRLHFQGDRFGFSPWEGPDAVLVVCCDEDLVHHRELGTIYGYENQEFSLELAQQLLPDGLTLLAGRWGEDGQMEWSLVPPGLEDPEALCYRVDGQSGSLRIVHPGWATGALAVLCDCRTTRGTEGNLRPGSGLVHAEEDGTLRRFHSPAPGRGGGDCETAEALRHRFVSDLRHPATAVRPSDYESLVMETPGLCIHKVRAEAVDGENLVRIAVKPRTEEKRPTLSPLYLSTLRTWLEPRRMLTTRIELLQPRYVPVDVRCNIYVKSYYSGAGEEVEALLRRALDYVNGPQGFGERLVFHQLYQALLDLPCVEAVDSLRLSPAAPEGMSFEGPDLVLDQRSLCYPGRLQVELHTNASGQRERR